MPTPLHDPAPHDSVPPGDAPLTDREVELKVAVHADGRQIVVRRETDLDARSGRRTLHIDAVVR